MISETAMNTPSKRILVVDDSTTTRLYLRRLLTGWGYQVEEAVTGYEGMEKALDSPFDLILTDINMPTMNGYAMTTALRKEPAAQSVPIITSSTESKDQDMARAYAAGANLYLVKPIQPDTLRHYVTFTIGEAT
jgi:two-component system chemotaxis response regulator CheY